MEYIKCPSCGKETPSVLNKCKHCGEQLNSKQEMEYPEDYQMKTRAGFTTFYLRFGLIVNSLMSIAYFITLFTRVGLWSAYEPMYSRVYGFVSSVIIAYGYWSLAQWNKSGFYILVLMAGVNQIMSLLAGGTLSLFTFIPFLSVLILYAVLQISKNGKSCWEQLS